MASERPFGPEGPECEWKERPPRPERLARTLAAFHNGAGGSLWVGVADDGSLVGVPDLEAARGAVTEAQQCVIAVFHDGRVSVDDDVMEIHELETNLSQRVSSGAELHVIIRGDADGAFQNVANVLSACRRAGVSDLGISVRMASRE